MQPPASKTKTFFFFEEIMAESSMWQSQVSQASKQKTTFDLPIFQFLIHQASCVRARGNYYFSAKFFIWHLHFSLDFFKHNEWLQLLVISLYRKTDCRTISDPAAVLFTIWKIYYPSRKNALCVIFELPKHGNSFWYYDFWIFLKQMSFYVKIQY